MSNNEVLSLNKQLYNDFTIEELEKRYELDPFLLRDLFSLGFSGAGDNNAALCASKGGACSDLVCACDNGYDSGCACKKISSCPELSCGCNHYS